MLLPSRSLIYFLMLTEHIWIEISKHLLFIESIFCVQRILTPFLYTWSLTLTSVTHSHFHFLPPFPLLVTAAYPREQRGLEVTLPRLLSALKVWFWPSLSPLSSRKTKSSLDLDFNHCGSTLRNGLSESRSPGAYSSINTNRWAPVPIKVKFSFL